MKLNKYLVIADQKDGYQIVTQTQQKNAYDAACCANSASRYFDTEIVIINSNDERVARRLTSGEWSVNETA
jgi:hypothetical protein